MNAWIYTMYISAGVFALMLGFCVHLIMNIKDEDDDN